MKKFAIIAISVMSICLSSYARNDVLEFSFSKAVNTPKAQGVLGTDIGYTFGGGHGQIILKGAVSNKKTNAFNKSDEEACNWALYSAIKSFQARARKEGGRKAINLVSFLDRKEYHDKSKFQCRVGTFTAAVVLKGDIAK